jgi:hypothetical protein
MTICSKLLNISGLTLVVAGCALLYRFGLPPDFDPTGAQHLILEQADQAAIAKGKRYRFWGRTGFALIAIGSAFQILATLAL